MHRRSQVVTTLGEGETQTQKFVCSKGKTSFATFTSERKGTKTRTLRTSPQSPSRASLGFLSWRPRDAGWQLSCEAGVLHNDARDIRATARTGTTCAVRCISVDGVVPQGRIKGELCSGALPH